MLRFTDSYIVGVVDLRAVEFPHLVEFVRCRFDSPPDLRQTKLNGCEFYECWLPGLEGHNLYSDNDIRFIGGTRVRGPARPHRRGDLRHAGAHRLAAGQPRRATRCTPTACSSTARCSRRTSRSTASCGYRACAPAATSTWPARELRNPEDFALDGNGLHVGGNLQCVPSRKRRFSATGWLYLPSARIDSDFSLRGAMLVPAKESTNRERSSERFYDPRVTLIADRCEVSGNVELDGGFEATGTIRMVNARIGGSMRLTGAKIDLSDGAEPFAELTGNAAPGPYRTARCTWTARRSTAASTPATRGSPGSCGWSTCPRGAA